MDHPRIFEIKLLLDEAEVGTLYISTGEVLVKKQVGWTDTNVRANEHIRSLDIANAAYHVELLHNWSWTLM